VLEELGTVDWSGLRAGRSDEPAREVPELLRAFADACPGTPRDTVDRMVCDLHELLAPGRVTAAGTAALPFLAGLATDPEVALRADVIELLASIAVAGEADPGWKAAWQRHRPVVRGLLADPDAVARRAALHFVEGRTGPLLERWRVETDPALRATLLLELGHAAVAEDPADPVVADVRAVLDGALHGEDRALRVAAAIGAASLDPRVPLRARAMLLELLTDPALVPEFSGWYTLRNEYPYDRESLASWVVHLLDQDQDQDPEAAVSFVAGLCEAGIRTDDAELRRCGVEEAWTLLSDRPSTAGALLPLGVRLMDDADDDIRYKAVHLLAVLGRRAAPCADRLAALLDDPGESHVYDGTVGDHARWALTRIGDPRALPDLVERLVAPYRDMQGRGYCPVDPRRPDVADVLRPLRPHAAELLPAVAEALRDEVARSGWLVEDLHDVLLAWDEDPVRHGGSVRYPLWQPRRLFPAEAEAEVLAYAAGGDTTRRFGEALDALLRHGRLTPAVRRALEALRGADRRLSELSGYPRVLQDEEIRTRIDAALALPS
jgi:hypothetical protein